MRGSHWFIICIVSFLVLMFAIECRLPKKFVWTPTFSHYDKQPFGCAVFDSLLSASLPMRYSVSGKTFYQLEQEDTVSRRAILVVNNHLTLTDVDVNALLKGAERGNKIMLVSNSFTGNLRDTLGFESQSFRYVMEVRFANKLVFSIQVDETMQDELTLPVLSLLPLVENVTVHNRIDSEHKMEITIRLNEQKELVVNNPIYPKLSPPDTNGTGLRNLESRFTLLMNRQIRIECDENTFRVYLPLNKQN